jgi:exodeoxyribonuclease V gamma subunit
MPFIQKISNTSEKLAEQLAMSLRDQVSIFNPVFIGLENPSTKDWLIDQVVQHNEIAANLLFIKPQACIEIVYRVLCKENERQERIMSSDLNWLIYSILEVEEFKSEFPEVAEYYNEDDLKRFTLAEKIGALFTKYQELDADLIEKLEGDATEGNNHQKWQGFLWKEVLRKTNGKFISISGMYESIRAALKDDDKIELLKQKVPQIRFYGTILYTSEFINLLEELGKYINIELFRINIPPVNSSRFLENLSPFQRKQSELFENLASVDQSKDSARLKDNLLSAIQQELKGNSKSNYNYDKTDDSIQIANNFSVYREVEALWNYLVDQFSKDKDLHQRDVCVLIPDIEKYAPAIKAIFGNEDLKIDFTFYDPSYKIQDSPYKALLALFALEKSEFTSKQVFGLLEFNYIREKFGFSEDLETVKRAIGLANIRHDIEGDKDLDTNLVSWRYGLKRLIYGACIEKTDDLLTFENESFYPVSEFEDRDLTTLIRLDYFVETLNKWLDEKKKMRSIKDWTILLEQTIEDFLAIDEYEPTQFNRQLGVLMKIGEMLVEKDITYSVFYYHLKKIFENLEITEKIGFGGIRFVSPNPYLNASSKIYCFLGMNGSDFPRKNNKLSFDLLEDKKEYSATELDKNMFLNLLVGAKEKIYISYIGQSVKDNSPIPPSTLIDDLLATCSNYGLHEDSLGSVLIKHPLHAFSSKYNDENERLIRFEKLKIEKHSQGKVEEDNQTDEEDDKGKNDSIIEIPLSDLIRFLEDPIRHYYNRFLGIYYSDKDIELQDCEPFTLGILAEWGLKDELLKKEIPKTEFGLENQRKGTLPLLNFGSKSLEKVNSAVEEIKLKMADKSTANKSTVPIDIKINNYRIRGEVDGVYDDIFMFATVSSDKFKYRIRAILNFMALSLQEEIISKGFYFNSTNTMEIILPNENENEKLKDKLNTFCALYEKGSEELIHFTCDFFTLKTESMNSFNFRSLNDFFLKELNDDYSHAHPSQYFIKELKNGFLNDDKSFNKFKETYKEIVRFLETTLI